MIIKSLADLQVYQRAHDAADAIYAILDRPVWRRERELRKQISECSDKIPSNISEGFGQGTDKHCAHFQRIARGSANEMCAHLRRARRKRLIDDEECRRLSETYETIGKMLTQWIKHLETENRQHRG
jgi:four helix bundle protein